jgi:tRNA-(ms[2]io[6]A)-hydroxylase
MMSNVRHVPSSGEEPVTILQEILEFLGGVATPEAWLEEALRQQEILLLDHRNLEYKAAQTALSLMGRYLTRTELTARMSRLAREELVHFEQVSKIIRGRGIEVRHVSASRYAAGLRALLRSGEVERLVDVLVVGAFIEARSCERFAALVPRLDAELAKFYAGLLESEGRHYRGYLKLAYLYGDAADVDARIEVVRAVEQELITSPDEQFRFHSGVPIESSREAAI